ncbi:RNA methyltransferase [Candidatus Micrarchaeota archaeon]|nr:RNA methyltransferase [Candidatus Micrarchaeota archaeon]
MRIRVILVEPEYEINLGYIARVMANFGFGDLVIVKPKMKIGRKARMFAKHGYHVLKNAKKVNRLNEAVKDCDLIVGTSGKVNSDREALRNPLSIRMFAKKISKHSGKIALLIGREGMGLNRREIETCDFIVTIPAYDKYPILNVSHALAILLYEIAQADRKGMLTLRKIARREEREELFKTFDSIVGSYSKGLRNADKIKLVLRRIIGRSMPTEIEIKAMLAIVKRMKNSLN